MLDEAKYGIFDFLNNPYHIGNPPCGFNNG